MVNDMELLEKKIESLKLQLEVANLELDKLKETTPIREYPPINVEEVTGYIKSWIKDFDYIIGRYTSLTDNFVKCDAFVTDLYDLAHLARGYYQQRERDASSFIHLMPYSLLSQFNKRRTIVHNISNVINDMTVILDIRTDIKNLNMGIG